MRHARRGFLRAGTLGIGLGAIVIFLPLRYLLQVEYDQELLELRPAIEAHLTAGDTVPARSYILTTFIEAHPAAPGTPAAARFVDTTAYDPFDREVEPYRKLTYVTTLRGAPYRVSISLLNVEASDLLWVILAACLALSLISLAFVGLQTRRGTQELWRPFRRTLDQLRDYRVGRTARPALEPSAIDEFQELNAAVDGMTARLEADYRRLREFTGNASHELQTPLAVIAGQLELLLQVEGLDAAAQVKLGAISAAVGRLRSLHRSLLQLTRVEGDDFAGERSVAVDALVAAELEAFAPQSESLALRVDTALAPLRLQANEDLLRLLVYNLIGNAVKHNRPGGWVSVGLDGAGCLRVSNSGSAHPLDVARVFDRFYRGEGTAHSLGLGLAIVHEICDRQGWAVAYRQEGERHGVEVAFAKQVAVGGDIPGLRPG